MKTTLEMIKNAIQALDEDMIEDNFFGIRIDECRYEVGDIANNSHELYQDPEFDEDGELIYEEGQGIYEGYYDAGELDGTCCISFDPQDDSSIEYALSLVSCYYGDYLHILSGSNVQSGNDEQEIVIKNAKVVAEVKN